MGIDKPCRNLQISNVWFSHVSFQVYLEMTAHDQHDVTLEHISVYDSESYSTNTNSASV